MRILSLIIDLAYIAMLLGLFFYGGLHLSARFEDLFWLFAAGFFAAEFADPILARSRKAGSAVYRRIRGRKFS